MWSREVSPTVKPDIMPEAQQQSIATKRSNKNLGLPYSSSYSMQLS